MHHHGRPRLRALILVLGILLTSCSTPQAFVISTDVASVAPFEIISLHATGASAGDSFTAQIDLSGTAQFAVADLMEVPTFMLDGMLALAAPHLEVIVPTTGTSRYDLRLRRTSDGATSNSVMLVQHAPPGAAVSAGVPTGTLDLVLRGLFATSDPRIALMGSKLGLSTVFDMAASLGHDTNPLDRMATAVLGELFGPTANSASASIDPAFLGPIRDGMAAVGTCLDDLMRDAPGSLAGAAALCSTSDLDAALRVVWEGSAGSLVDVFDRLARVANTGASLLTRPFSTASQLTETLAHRAYLGTLVQRSGTLALYANEYGRTNDLTPFLEFAAREGTRDYLISQLDGFTPHMYDFLNGDQLLQHVIDLDFEAQQSAITLEEELSTAVDGFLKVQNDHPDIFGGEEPPGIDEELEWVDDVCTSPDIEILPGVTCAQFVLALQDPVMSDRILDILRRQLPLLELLSGPLCQLDPWPLTCESAFASLEDLYDEMAALFDGEGAGSCASAYVAFGASAANFLTCIHASLVTATLPATCHAGSYAASARGLDVGGAHVCVLYSRDYFQPDGTCRQGYRETLFDGTQRCRWAGLGDNEDVAYSVDKDSGRRITLIR